MTTEYAQKGEKRVVAEGPWVHLSSELTMASDHMAGGRRDLMVTVAPGAGHGSKACFSPDKRWIEIDARAVMAELGISEVTTDLAASMTIRDLKPSWRWDDRDKIPATWGLLTHEAAHAAHTKWTAKADPKKLLADPDEMAAFEAAKLLEEPRIEYEQSWRRWWDTRWLRMSASRFLLDELKPGDEASARQIAARTMTLIQGRVLGGILDKEETAAVVGQARYLLGKDADPLEAVVSRALDVKDGDYYQMMELGREWVRIVGEPPVPPQGGSGQGNGESDGDGISEQLVKALMDAASSMGTQIQLSHGWPGGTEPSWIRRGFDCTWRQASARQKTKAALLARRLRDWSIPERSATQINKKEPPGRLSVREAIRGDAQAWSGMIPDVEPWRRIDRRVVQTPPLRVGIVVDVSGSMDQVAEHSRELAFRLSTAFASVPDARMRATLAGRGVAPMQSRAGWVPHYDYDHGTQEVHLAIDDLADHLALYRRGNGRLLIIISDGRLHGQQTEGTQRRLRNLKKAGCRILWLDFAGSMSFDLEKSQPDAEVIELRGDPEQAADIAELALSKILAGLKP